MSYCIALDCEMTAQQPGEICQLAFIRWVRGAAVGENLYFAVQSMTERALGVHGLTLSELQRLSGGRTFAHHAARLYDLLTGASVIIGHSVMVDVRFLAAEFARCGLLFEPKSVFCTRDAYVALRKQRDGLRVGWPPLQRVMDYCNVTPADVCRRACEWFRCGDVLPHDARFDAAAALLCAQALNGQPFATEKA